MAARADTQLSAVDSCRRYPLAELIGTLKELYPLTAKATLPSQHTSAVDAGTDDSSSTTTSSSDDVSSSSSSKKKRRSHSDDFVVIEYVLLKDVNDTDADAHRLLELLSEVYCMINLIVFNPHEGTAFQRSEEQQVRKGCGYIAMQCHGVSCNVVLQAGCEWRGPLCCCLLC